MANAAILDPAAAGARRFEGEVAVIAGAGQGIGRATARRLAQEGAAVMAADLIEASAERVRSELVEAGAKAATFAGNLSELDNCRALMARTKDVFGRIDVLVNVVGGTIWTQSFQYYTPEQIEAEIAKSFWPPMFLCWAVLPYMIEQRAGAIVNLATHAVASRYRVPYAAAKGGVIALTTSLAKEVAQYGIRVNVMAPHATQADDRVTPRNAGIALAASELPPEERAERDRFFGDGFVGERVGEFLELEIPMKRFSRASEQAAAIAFLASDDASYITGQVLPVGGGATYPF